MGYPNVGKSALFNALKRRQIALVSAVPCSTIEMNQLQYNETCNIADCPALDPEYSNEDSSFMRYVISGSTLLDPVSL